MESQKGILLDLTFLFVLNIFYLKVKSGKEVPSNPFA